MKALCIPVFCLGVAWCQSAFEVASVKLSGPLDPQKIMSGQMRIGKKVDKARVEYNSMSLDALIMEAYKVKSFQLQGPEWMSGMSAPRFDIQAKVPDGATEDQIPEMMQKLLAERFGLKIHRTTKEHSLYALVVAPTGLKIKPFDAAAEAPADDSQGIKISGNIQDSKGVTVKNGPDGGTTRVQMSPDMKSMRMEFSKMPMLGLVELLSRLVDKPVIDETGLKGDYQLSFELPMSAMMAVAGAMNGGQAPGGGMAGRGMPEASDPGASIFESVQKMGLKLDSRKAPLETIVVDHLEKAPTEN